MAGLGSYIERVFVAGVGNFGGAVGEGGWGE